LRDQKKRTKEKSPAVEKTVNNCYVLFEIFELALCAQTSNFSFTDINLNLFVFSKAEEKE